MFKWDHLGLEMSELLISYPSSGDNSKRQSKHLFRTYQANLHDSTSTFAFLLSKHIRATALGPSSPAFRGGKRFVQSHQDRIRQRWDLNSRLSEDLSAMLCCLHPADTLNRWQVLLCTTKNKRNPPTPTPARPRCFPGRTVGIEPSFVFFSSHDRDL